jgi:hypothetical protein
MSATDPMQTVRFCTIDGFHMLNKSAIRLIVFLFLASIVAEASDPMPGWSHRWSANVWNTYCELKLDYYIPFRRDAMRRGLLANTGYDQAFVRFASTTRMHYDLYPEEELFKVRFQLYIYGENGVLPAPESRILSARIGDFELDPPENAEFWIHMFSLDEEATSKLLGVFRANERVEVTIRLANGEERRSTIYPSGDRDFHVWEAMFEACIRKNVGPRR